MTKLHELIAVEPSLKVEATEASKSVQGAFADVSVFAGQARKYRPLEDGGDALASETHLPRVQVNQLLSAFAGVFGGWVDVSVQKELTNTVTKASVVVDGITVLENLPATALLNLENKLDSLVGTLKAIPTLDPAVKWSYDENQGFYVSDERVSYRTEKRMETHVEYEATKEHPAQVQTYNKDVRVGEWNTIHYSGAMPRVEKEELVSRLEKLRRSVKQARQRANDVDITERDVADKIFGYLFN